MTRSRREVLGGLAALTACGGRGEARGDVFAAGQPAAVLLLALAPGRLLGWPRRPSAQALRLLPANADLPERGALTGGGAPANLEAVAALRPAMILDYGDVQGGYREVAERSATRLGAPYHLLDGALGRTPQVLRQAGRLLGVPERGMRLGEAARAMLARQAGPAGTGPSFYYARGRDGLETAFAGALAVEVPEWAGWRSVATGGRDIGRGMGRDIGGDIGRVAREQVAAWDPEVVLTLDRGFAQGAAADPFWRVRRGGARRKLLLLPDLPFGWIDRPPSVNRLLGCAWFGGRGAGGAAADAMRVGALLYGHAAAAGPAPRWIE